MQAMHYARYAGLNEAHHIASHPRIASFQKIKKTKK